MGVLRAQLSSPSIIGRRPKLSLFVAIALALAISITLKGCPSDLALDRSSPVVAAVLSDPGSPRVGSEKPDVIIVVFTDYQCAICKATDPALGRLLAKDKNIKIIFKDWPVFGPNSELAARAALAAQRQGKYYGFHRALMSSHRRVDSESIDIAMGTAGVDRAQARQDLAERAPEINTQLGKQALQAWSLGLAGTPGYLVGPYLIQGGINDRALARMVRRARNYVERH